ncbi:unnamed protein product [Anisakis simplex]|uniref:ABC transporter ATP-binding protein n=1 Tax=Anisakis simplex TaxID=6269 RepID=A0A0M3JP39_ANISI|nr:unnamed protein product [Anisakis simplex]
MLIKIFREFNTSIRAKMNPERQLLLLGHFGGQFTGFIHIEPGHILSQYGRKIAFSDVMDLTFAEDMPA